MHLICLCTDYFSRPSCGSSNLKIKRKKCCVGYKELDIKSNITIYSNKNNISIHGIAILKEV